MKTDLFYEKGDYVLYDRDSERVLAIFNTEPTRDQVIDVIYRAQTGEINAKKEKQPK